MQHDALKPKRFDRTDAFCEASLAGAQAGDSGKDHEMMVDSHNHP
jgi:hypothetical protein